MYQRIRHNSIATHHPNTLIGRRVAAPVTLPKAPWESMEMKEEDIKKLEESSRGSTIKKGTTED